ncbi:MAG: ABC transporter ATP-binding protein [Lachnospiraceae bacterium]|nr:ABC transporter ATP-binding protein [Lachnospiraceae bacterium]
MNGKVRKILKETGMTKDFIFVMILRAPFNFLNAVLAANMLESFIRLIEIKEEGELLSTFGIFLLFTIMLFGYNMFVWAFVSMKINIRFIKKLRMRVYKSLLSRTGQEMEELSAGDWISRLNSDIDKTDLYLMGPLNFVHLLNAAVNLTLSSIVLFILNKTMLAAALIITLPFFFLSSVVIIRKIPIYKKKSREHYARFTNWMEPVVNASESIRIFEGEELVKTRAEQESLEILRNNMKAHRRNALAAGVNTFSGMTGYLLLLFLGNSMLGRELENFARMMKITQYRGEMMKSVMMTNSCIGRMKGNLPAAERVEKIL